MLYNNWSVHGLVQPPELVPDLLGLLTIVGPLPFRESGVLQALTLVTLPKVRVCQRAYFFLVLAQQRLYHIFELQVIYEHLRDTEARLTGDIPAQTVPLDSEGHLALSARPERRR